ncbi:hypothetical protein F4680DRAFT_138977 [Xylaria scruposa]|nr:hypothetical protein F4680DRAFT_138977 [Xylaria scruposa]
MAENDELIFFNLFEVDDQNFEFRLQNFGKEQQINFTGQDRLNENIVLCGRRIHTVHGALSDGTPSSLVVFEWYVHARVPGKRFKFVQIGVQFESTTGDPFYHPAVKDLAPRGSCALEETTDQVEAKRGWSPSVSLGFMGVLDLGTGYEYSQTRAGPRKDRIVVNGGSLFGSGSRYPDRHHQVEWNLFENESIRSGVPQYFRTAVLLERRDGDMGRFTAKFSIKTKVDLVENMTNSLKNLIGLQISDDPIIFNPATTELVPRIQSFINSLDDYPLKDESVFLLFTQQSGKKENNSDA